MIDFPCPCGQYKFSVPDDMSGGLIQCPKCRRLNDVPTLSDLAHIDPDGAYKLEPEPQSPPADEIVADASLAFTRQRYDEDGFDIDLRSSQNDLIGVGGETIQTGQTIPAERPRYDPVTGELIRPIDLRGSDQPKLDPRKLPMARRAAPPVVYDDDNPAPLDSLLIPLRLLRPLNLFVMCVIVVAHLFSQAMMVLIAWGFWLIAIFFLVLQGMFFSHYGNVIDETGPTHRNELPTPLRNLNWHEDTWGPFARMMGTLIVCYGPSFAAIWQDRLPIQIRLTLAAVLAVAGTLAAPAVMLTVHTSGTWLNLRPDRLLGVIRACGIEYLLPLVLWIIVTPLYFLLVMALYLITFHWSAQMLFTTASRPMVVWFLPSVRLAVSNQILSSWTIWIVAYAGLVIAVFLMHWLCWSLGTLYRRHHERFPWIYQRYDRDARHGHAPPRGFSVQRRRRQAQAAQSPQRAIPINLDEHHTPVERKPH